MTILEQLLLLNKLKMLFSKLKELLTELGVKDSPDKESKLMTGMIFLGLIYDMIAMTVSLGGRGRGK